MRRLFSFVMLFLVGSTALWADAERKISLKELPKEAQLFLKENFGGQKVLFAQEEYEYTHDKKEYEVRLSDGTKVEFDKMGVWKNVDCNNKKLPQNLIPKKIQKFLLETYPKADAVKIERDLYGYEIELNNGRELVFDDNGIFIRFDD